MAALSTDVLVIGGGATGAGVAWDAALRGFHVVLADRLDLCEGTSGRFHGLLHSGGRYVVKDPRAAEECIVENRILREIAADCIEDTGGLFVTTPFDDPAYADRFAEGCRATGVDCEEVEPTAVLREEPRLHPDISRAFRVPDASIDAWKTVWALARGAHERRGAQILPYPAAVDVHRRDDQVTGALLRDVRTGEEVDVEARVTVNATGAWAGKLADLAGIEGVRVLPGRGIMIAMNHRLVDTVVNRCQMPTDGDILVPIRTVSVMGTTDVHTDDPDDHTVAEEEVDAMLADGERLVPGFRQARALREDNLRDDQLVCECELITRSKLEESMRMRGTDNLGDFRRVLRLGMGPCQGGFCIYRATGIMHGIDGLTAEQANEALLSFLQERWKGVWPILYGDQLRQARLDDWIFQGVLDVGHLRRREPRPPTPPACPGGGGP